ncbi:MAG: hypothetical protein EOP49_11745 [Sphingobacteriales bacterium]|nr:MAG: hypothetical protein EOP49_11745 [Sphingobacteriales bacterium]
MKQLLLSTIALASVNIAGAQVHTPLHKGLRPVTNATGTPLNVQMVQRVDSVERALQYNAALDLGMLRLVSPNTLVVLHQSPGEKAVDTIRFDIVAGKSSALALLSDKQRDTIESSIAPYIRAYRRQELMTTALQLNEATSRFQPLIAGGLTNILQPGSSSGNLTLGVQFRLTPFKVKGDVIDPHYLYAAWSASTAKSGDTSNLLKSIVFPELAKNDFIFGWKHESIKGNLVKGLFAEVRLTTFADTSKKWLFRSESLVAGYQWAFMGSLPLLQVPAGFRIQPYLNVVNIDSKYREGLDKATNNVPVYGTFFNVGCRIQADIGGAALFFNGKYILNKQGELKEPDMVRFVYTIGTAVAL